MKFIPFPSSPKEREGKNITSLHFGPDNQTLVAVERSFFREGGLGVGLSWWDLQTQAEIVLDYKDSDLAIGAEEFARYVPDPVLSLDHRFLAYVYIERGPEHSLRFINRSERKGTSKHQRLLNVCESIDYTRQGGYLALQFSPDNQYLLAALGPNAAAEELYEIDEIPPYGIYRWKVETILKGRGPKFGGQLLPSGEILPIPPSEFLEDGPNSGWNMVFSLDNSLIAAGFWSDRILCWEFPSGRALPEVRIQNPDNVIPLRIAFSPDPKMLAVATQSIALYEVPSMTLTRTISLPKTKKSRHPSRICDIAFHPSQPILATANNQSSVRWWDTNTGTEKETFDWEIGKITAIAFSPDGCLCASAGEKGIAIWDVSQ